jgi:hypothetical protein
VIYEYDDVQSLCDLACIEVVLVPVPETTTTSRIRVMADSMTLEMSLHTWIGDLCLERRYIQWTVVPIDARFTGLSLDLEPDAHDSSSCIRCLRITSRFLR